MSKRSTGTDEIERLTPASSSQAQAKIGAALTKLRTLVASDPATAVEVAHYINAQTPTNAEAYRLAGRAYRYLGQANHAERAEMLAIRASACDPELQEAARALFENRLEFAEPILRERLKTDPTDVAAIRMLAELAGRIARYADAEKLLRRALDLAPGFNAARSNLATVLHRQNRTEEALAELDTLLAGDPENPAYGNLRAAALGRIGEFDEAIACYESVLRQRPDQPKVWMSYGHVLKTVGRQEDSISAYRRAIALQPGLGEAWWSLANLKTVKLDHADITTMQTALAGGRLSVDDRFHLDFALGKAHDDAANPAGAIGHYRAANDLRRSQLDYDSADTTRQVDRAILLHTPEFLAARAGHGNPAPDPIFIVGLPRSGSTLIEQILASHSMVEGTMELPDIPILAAEAGNSEGGLAKAHAGQLHAFGGDYLERTQIQRKAAKPYFIDKLPNNWLHIGFIHLILPNAKIIDARRHPLDCCFSNFRQHFARGQGFSYSLADVARYYRDYVRLMSHFDAILPGRVHRIFHERLIDDPRGEIELLLGALGLPFEEACLDFHSNKRAVRTASSEQVRRPINREGIGQWRAYKEWLGPLRDALRPVLDDYPDII